MILRRHVLLTALFPLLLAHRVSAQNTEDQNAFDFSLPGARSRGIGGAFVATADDATAAYSNPAGLTLLFRPEVSAEGRYWQFTNRTLNKGHGYGRATGIGVDTINGFVDTDFHSSVAGLSFLSFVFPRDRWAIGVFRHQLAQYEMDRQIEGAFYDCQGGYREEPVTQSKPPFCNQHAKTDGVDREFPKLQSYDLDIYSVGAAFAYKLSDKISAGIAVQNFGFSIDATNKVFTARDAQKYQPPNYADPENLEVTATQTGDDRAWAVNAGILWEVTPRWVAGASFRQGPTFEFSTKTVLGPRGGGTTVSARDDNPFHVPDTFSAGLQHRLTDFWRLSFEYDRTNFHQLIEDFRNTSLFPGDPEADLALSRLRLNDADQFRFGAERLVLVAGGRVLAFRGGAWYDPNHLMYFDADESTGLPAPRWAVLFPKRDGAVHVSGGAGFTARRHLQVDVAVDFSEPVNTFAVSGVWRF
jgi:long-chain fatty acid transport protein